MPGEEVVRFILVISCIVGFIFFDLFYVAAVINYASQCQLLCFYIASIMDKVQDKAYTLEDAIKVRVGVGEERPFMCQ